MLKEAAQGMPMSPMLLEKGLDVALKIARDIVTAASLGEASYLLFEHNTAILCLNCGLISRNTHDVEQRYCGGCQKLHKVPA